MTIVKRVELQETCSNGFEVGLTMVAGGLHITCSLGSWAGSVVDLEKLFGEVCKAVSVVEKPVAASAETFHAVFSTAVEPFLDLSVRASNCLQNAGIMFIGELVQESRAGLKKRGFGIRTINEIERALTGATLHYNMDVQGWVPPSDLGTTGQ